MTTKAENQMIFSLSNVPGPGIEPGWIAPTVFETVASTDSAIRAGRWCKGTHNILNRNTAMQHWMRSMITNRDEWMLNRMKVHIFALFLSSQDTVFFLYFLMIERIVIIDNVDPVSFYGVNNSNMQLIRNLFPKLRVTARGSVLRVLGDEEDTAMFEQKIKELEAYCAKYNKLTEDVIIDVMRGEKPKDVKGDGVVIYGVNGKPISPRNHNQQLLVEAFNENDLTFALGPAGTGKTYLAIALAVKALKNKEARKIILSRPAVEAGEKLGFLPGDMKDKIDPYLQPLYDALEDMIPAVKLKEYMESNVIQIAPLAFMRGRTLNDAIIVLDEAQNTTTHQIKMFLTRLGMNAKMIITGDVTQIDLPRSVTSGLVQALRVLRDVHGIGKVEFGKKDIVRHALVQRIVEAYDHFDKEQEQERKASSSEDAAQQ